LRFGHREQFLVPLECSSAAMATQGAEAEAAAAAVSRASIEDFLRTCIDALRSDACRETMRTSEKRPGPQLLAIQQEVLDNLGIPTHIGQLAVSRIEKNFPDDHAELVTLRTDFGKAVDTAYLRCCEDRRPATLEKKAKMRRGIVLEFLDVCRVLLDSEPVRDRLKATIQATGKMPEDTLNEVHGEAMEFVGFDRDHGLKCFTAFGNSKEFTRDKEVAMAVARWRSKNSAACLRLLAEFHKEGGKIDVDDEVTAKLYEFRAKAGLDEMSTEDRTKLLEKNAKKVNVFRGLPTEARLKWIEKLGDEERLELTQSEILMVTMMNARQRQQAQGRVE